MLKFDFIKKQAGVVFGMDARIAIVILAIASMAIAINRLAINESSRLQEATYQILKISELVEDYYRENNTDLSELATLYSQATALQDSFWKGHDNLKNDPWGNQWQFVVSNADIVLVGETVNAKCVTVFSPGGDSYGYLASLASGQTYSDCINNTNVSNAGISQTQEYDDLFYKFTTVKVEYERILETNAKLEEIKTALINYQQAKLNTELEYCNGLAQAVADLDARCDLNASGTYEQTELETSNHLPKSSLDVTVAIYSDATVYTDKDLASMQLLMTQLGLPTDYAQDGFKRVLSYNSNLTSSILGPYYAEIFYE